MEKKQKRKTKKRIVKIKDEHGNILLVEPKLPNTKFPFNEVSASLVCQYVMEGMSIQKIGKMEGMPPAQTIYMWKRKFPKFRDELEEALKDRAMYYHDKALEAAEEVVDKDDVPAAKLKTDTYRWAAGVADKERFGTKVPNERSGGDLVIMIDTGIVREEKEVNVDVVSSHVLPDEISE